MLRPVNAPGAGRRRGSSGPPTTARGLVLVLVGVILGVVLLRSAFDTPAASVDAPGTTTTTTAVPTTGTGDTGTTVAPAVRPRSEVSVLVANGSGIPGAAGRLSEQLATLNYVVLPATDATRDDYTLTEVQYAEGYLQEALRLATEDLGLASTQVKPLSVPAPVANTQGANIIVVLGPDIATPPPG